jgi:hypothetical protein
MRRGRRGCGAGAAGGVHGSVRAAGFGAARRVSGLVDHPPLLRRRRPPPRGALPPFRRPAPRSQPIPCLRRPHRPHTSFPPRPRSPWSLGGLGSRAALVFLNPPPTPHPTPAHTLLSRSSHSRLTRIGGGQARHWVTRASDEEYDHALAHHPHLCRPLAAALGDLRPARQARADGPADSAAPLPPSRLSLLAAAVRDRLRGGGGSGGGGSGVAAPGPAGVLGHCEVSAGGAAGEEEDWATVMFRPL